MKQRRLLIGGLLLAMSLSSVSTETSAKDSVYLKQSTFSLVTPKIDVKQAKKEIVETHLKQLNMKGYITSVVNVRSAPNTKSSILGKLSFNEVIEYANYNKNWVKVLYHGKYAYVCKQYVSDKKCNYRSVKIPNHRDFKSFMPYEAIKSWTPKDLQDVAYTGTYGIRMVDGRYCVAVGTACKADIGTYVDLVLANRTVIPAIVSDTKADKDTQSNNLITADNDCCSEFIVNVESLPYAVRNSNHTGSGNISSCCKEWESPVVEIRVFKTNYFKK